jgi:hypothetical protein
MRSGAWSTSASFLVRIRSPSERKKSFIHVWMSLLGALIRLSSIDAAMSTWAATKISAYGLLP